MKKNKAFTLLEMLIVLGLIAVILSIMAVSYTTSQRKSRDARRKSDIKILQSGLEQYYAQCGVYAYPTQNPSTNGLSTSISCSGTTLVPTVPLDPKTGQGYIYTTATGTTFTLCIPTMAPPTSSVFESEVRTSYCVTNQQ